ncbi:hypothetical protein BD410DRAFT_847090 [Rickenella mellea]|uniref:Glyoxalase/fosfomycin resistance/dioxygenase domain-containing protein n=1 Tax=Rickenella mellea TaxID=50990 RepID=A0A4Y7PDF5_9AGAM|nr:hypothetical protein BD410DRAFT_847090 [Rickenella mellea]
MLHSPAPPGSPECKTTYGPSELLIRLSGDEKGKEIVDEWHDKIVKNGVVAKEKPEDKPWNCRQAVFTDPDGHELQFYFWLGTTSK